MPSQDPHKNRGNHDENSNVLAVIIGTLIVAVTVIAYVVFNANDEERRRATIDSEPNKAKVIVEDTAAEKDDGTKASASGTPDAKDAVTTLNAGQANE